MLLRRVGLVVVVVLGAGCGAGTPSPSGDPDPGGRTLRNLESAAAAVPVGAHLTHRNDAEPRWDSCDGRTNTFGWDDADVERFFTTRDAAGAVLAGAERRMAHAGWRLASRTGRQLVWRRASAEAELVPGPAGGWELDAEAPPHGRRATGC